MDEIILIGAGGHARSCIDVIELSRQFKVAGLVAKDDTDGNENLGYPIIGTDNDLQDLRNKYEFSFVTVGQIKSAATRVRLVALLSELEYKLPVIVSPTAYVSKHAQIGNGTIIMHNAVVNANAKIGKNCIINTRVLIEHDATVGDHCHIATGAIVNGGVSVGSESFIGSGVVTKHYVSIGKTCLIEAGSIIKTDIGSNQVIKN